MHMVWILRWIRWVSATETEEDGFSLHETEKHANYFAQRHRQSLPAILPREYSMPYGDPYTEKVDQGTYEQVRSADSTFGIRCDTRFSNNGKTWVARSNVAPKFNPIRPSE